MQRKGHALTPEQKREFKEEAKRLALLPREEQRQIIALHRSVAGDPKVSKRDRDLARERADALKRYLHRLNHGKKGNK
jgi:hypothetical protein